MRMAPSKQPRRMLLVACHYHPRLPTSLDIGGGQQCIPTRTRRMPSSSPKSFSIHTATVCGTRSKPLTGQG